MEDKLIYQTVYFDNKMTINFFRVVPLVQDTGSQLVLNSIYPQNIYVLTSIALYIQEYNEIRQTFDLNYIVYTLFGLEEYSTIFQSQLVMVV